jgi:hypothetical protein
MGRDARATRSVDSTAGCFARARIGARLADACGARAPCRRRLGDERVDDVRRVACAVEVRDAAFDAPTPPKKSPRTSSTGGKRETEEESASSSGLGVVSTRAPSARRATT